MFRFVQTQQRAMLRRPVGLSGAAFGTATRRLLNPPPAATSAAAAAAVPNPFLTTQFGGSARTGDVSRDEVMRLAKLLEADPEFARRVVGAMAPDARRQLVVAGGAVEWFGKERAAREVQEADENRDLVICPKDFERWFERALQRRVEQRTADAEGSAAGAAPGAQGEHRSGAEGEQQGQRAGADAGTHVPFKGLFFVALQAALPFVGFGFLDNAIMILAGDAIDRTLGFYFGCTMMASAAMGNVVSGAMGMQVHGTVERLIHLLRLPTPVLTEAQRASRRVFLAGHLGGTLGIATGLTLGMLPLLFISDESEKSDKRAFAELDVNHDGFVTMIELDAAIAAAGLAKSVSHVRTEQLVAQYGAPGAKGLTTQQFHAMCSSLRKQAGTSGPVAA